MTQLALGTSVLWLWIAFMDLLAMFPSKQKDPDQRSEKSHKWYRFWKHFPSLRTFQNTLSSLVRFGEAVGVLCVAIVCIGVVAIVIITMDSSEKMAVGAHSQFI